MRRRRRMYRRSRLRPWLCLLLIIAAVWLLLVWADARLRPQLHALAAMQALQVEEHAMNDAVLRALGDGQYDTLVTVVQNDAGRVSSIQTDALQINVLKGRISEAACGALAAHTLTAAIPIGSLTGLDILAGRGFALHVPVRTAGYAVSDVQSVFSDAGVNQTVHRLMLTVHAEVCLSMAKTQKTETLAYEVCIAETVIVGEVPQFYANTGK
ncbi:MAG: sporulation protein YunB [Clostridia bacterium]|nr:sporulation protein YunB [Clostridia bacterium]